MPLLPKPIFESERDFLRWLTDQVPAAGRSVKLGIGDDAALVGTSAGCEIILKSDLSIEGTHFDRRIHPPRSIGHRALARSLSDIAAMGGQPRFALISLAIPRSAKAAWVKNLLRGVFDLAASFRVVVVGGDTSMVDGAAAIDAILTGEVPKGSALLRSGAREGDAVYVSGRLGYSALGLEILQTQGKPSQRSEPSGLRLAAIKAHLYPEPRLAIGRMLRERRLATALIDVSDGLSSDLARLCQASGRGAMLWADTIPTPGTSKLGMDLALHGGEDYELLFTVTPANVSKIPKKIGNVPLHRIGEVQQQPGVRIIGPDGKEAPLKPLGWDHFRWKAARGS